MKGKTPIAFNVPNVSQLTHTYDVPSPVPPRTHEPQFSKTWQYT